MIEKKIEVRNYMSSLDIIIKLDKEEISTMRLTKNEMKEIINKQNLVDLTGAKWILGLKEKLTSIIYNCFMSENLGDLIYFEDEEIMEYVKEFVEKESNISQLLKWRVKSNG